jgi:hypothetical protein
MAIVSRQLDRGIGDSRLRLPHERPLPQLALDVSLTLSGEGLGDQNLEHPARSSVSSLGGKGTR